jgi:hypothetical protein
VKEDHPEKFRDKMFSLFKARHANLFGIVVLSRMYGFYADTIAGIYDQNDLDGPVDDEVLPLFLKTVVANRITSASTVQVYNELDTVYASAFDRAYIDPHGLVDRYCEKLHTRMNKYAANPKHYVAPYTSLVTSSMMGKSRLIKQIARHIPTIYIVKP